MQWPEWSGENRSTSSQETKYKYSHRVPTITKKLNNVHHQPPQHSYPQHIKTTSHHTSPHHHQDNIELSKASHHHGLSQPSTQHQEWSPGPNPGLSTKDCS